MKYTHRLLVMLIACLPQAAHLQLYGVTDWASEGDQFEEHLALWKSRDIHDYSFVMDAQCFCEPGFFPARIVVGNGAVVSVFNPDNGNPIIEPEIPAGLPVPREHESRFKTIDELFAIVEESIENNDTTTHPGYKVSVLNVEYDEYYGYPTAIYRSSDKFITNDGQVGQFTDGNAIYKASDLNVEL